MSRHNITSSKICNLDETGNSTLQVFQNLSVLMEASKCRVWRKSQLLLNKIDQLDVNFFIVSLFTAQHVSYVNTSILRSLRLICWVISWVVLLWFDVCWCYVVVWLGWCGTWMQAESLIQTSLLPAYYLRTTSVLPVLPSVPVSQFRGWPVPFSFSYTIS